MQRWLMAGFITASLFGSVLLHELAHSLTAKRLGYRVMGITLLVFGGVSMISENRTRALHDFWIAFAGPLMSFLLGVAGIALGFLLSDSDGVGTGALLETWLRYLGFMNLILAAFNMLPGIPLDGGRVLQALVWWKTGNRDKAALISAIAGRVVAFLIVAYGLYVMFIQDSIMNGVWLILLGLFIGSSAIAETRVANDRIKSKHASGIPVGMAMSPAPTALNINTPLDAAVRNVLSHYPSNVIPVVSGGKVSGFITMQDVVSLGLVDGSQMGLTVADAAHTSSTLPVSPDVDVTQALEMINKRRVDRLLVFDGDRVVGSLGRAEISAALERTQSTNNQSV